MEKKLETLEQIALQLHDAKSVHTINLLQERLQDKQFRMPIIGQFSSGKSRLLNQVFGYSLLPTRQTETTAFTTVIEYGESDSASILLNDGNKHQLELQNIRNINQAELDYRSLGEIIGIPNLTDSEVDSIHIKFAHPILEKGLVFIDTPGLNTVFADHEERTHDILPSADLVLYVLGKSVTAQDLELIQALHASGVSLLFVRTKLDELLESEGDTPERAIADDKKLLKEKLLVDDVNYFGLTNLEELLIQDKWSNLSLQFLLFIKQQVTGDLDRLRMDSIKSRLTPIRASLLTQLKVRITQVEQSKTSSLKQLQENRQVIERAMKLIERQSADERRHISQTFNEFEQNLKKQYVQIISTSKSKLEQQLKVQNTIQGLQEIAEQETVQYQKRLVEEMKDATDTAFLNFITSNVERFNLSLQDIELEKLTIKGFEAIPLHVEVPTMNDIAETADFINQQQYILEEYKKKMSRVEKEHGEIKEILQKNDEEKSIAEYNFNNLSAYEPQYIERQRTDSKESLEQMGNIVDWAMIFIPGPVYVKAATKVSQVITGAKVVQQSANALKIAEQVSKGVMVAGELLSKTDKTTDALKLLNKATGTISNASEVNEEKKSRLDLITAKYWLGQVGQMLDGPPELVEDQATRRLYDQQRDQLKRELDEKSRQEMMIVSRQARLKSQEDRIKQEMELRREQMQREQKALAELEQKRQENELMESIGTYRRAIIQQYTDNVEQLKVQMTDFLKKSLQPLSNTLHSTLALPLQEKLNQQRQQLEVLEEQIGQTTEKQEQYENELRHYIQFVQG